MARHHKRKKSTIARERLKNLAHARRVKARRHAHHRHHGR